MLRLLLIAALVLAWLAGPTHAAPRIELNLLPAQPGHVLGETVAVVVRLTNAGDQPATVARHLRPEYANVRFTVAREGGPPRAYAPWGIKDAAEPFAILAPGESLVEVADLFYDARGWVFTSPGTWTIEATFADTVPAAPLQLTIAPPRNEAERAAAEVLLASSEAGRFLLLRGGDHLPAGMAVLDQVAREQPGTPHAATADLALGINALTPFPNFATGAVPPADPAAAAERLERVQDRPLGPARTVEAVLALAAAYSQLGRDALAIELKASLIDRLRQRFPDLDPDRLGATLVSRVRRQLSLN
jgi:hypothetical protein